MTKITFNSKETYLQFRAVWKQQYKALSEQIRSAKAWRREYSRYQAACFSKKFAGTFEEFLPAACARSVIAIRNIHRSPYGEMPQQTCRVLREQATCLLAELKYAKVIAQQQYEESRKTTTVTPC